MTSKINSIHNYGHPCDNIEPSYAIVTTNRRQGLIPTEDFSNVTFKNFVPDYWDMEAPTFARWNLIPIPDEFRKTPDYPLEDEIADTIDMRRRPYMLIDPVEQRVVGERCPNQSGDFPGCVYIFDNYYLPVIFTVKYFYDNGFPSPQNILTINNNTEVDILAVTKSDINVLSTEFGKNIDDVRLNCFANICNGVYDARCSQYFKSLPIEERKRVVQQHCNVTNWKVNLCSGLCRNDPDLKSACTAAHNIKCSNLRPDNAGILRETCACFYPQEVYDQQISKIEQALDRFEGERFDQLRQIIDFIRNSGTNTHRKCVFHECANAPFQGSYDRIDCSDVYTCFQETTINVEGDIGEIELNILNDCITRRQNGGTGPGNGGGGTAPPEEDNATGNLIIWSIVIIVAIVVIAVFIYFIFSRIQRSRRR